MTILDPYVMDLASGHPGCAGHAEDLRIAAEAVLHGGRAAMEFYRSEDLDVRDPTGRGPVTRADRASHEAISAVLGAHRSGDSVLSEEATSDERDLGRRRQWIVDPLDGTREFIDRIGEFSVMVGLAVDGVAVLGAVYRPDPGMLYVGVAEQAAWRLQNGGQAPRVERLRASSDPEGLRFVQSRSHPDERLQRLVDELEPSRTILSGSVGTKCALIAEGEADLYVHPVPYLKEWDTCAPEAVLRGAGGRVTDCRGGMLVYGKPDPAQPLGIFAARNAIWERFASTIIDFGEEL